MQQDNRDGLTPTPPQEPQEVVSWYVRPDDAREVQDLSLIHI